jgi:hypothetical protein
MDEADVLGTTPGSLPGGDEPKVWLLVGVPVHTFNQMCEFAADGEDAEDDDPGGCEHDGREPVDEF